MWRVWPDRSSPPASATGGSVGASACWLGASTESMFSRSRSVMVYPSWWQTRCRSSDVMCPLSSGSKRFQAARTTLKSAAGVNIPTPSVVERRSLSCLLSCCDCEPEARRVPWRSCSLTSSWCSSAAISSEPWIARDAVLKARSRSTVSGSGRSGTSSPRTQLWASSCAAVSRLAGSGSRSWRTSCFARPEMRVHCAGSKEYSARKMRPITCDSGSPGKVSKGCRPDSIM
mmetsp:Transcript_2408/g.7335  ORF Transcript_2408/g.7335 Transcript_2408/m.7335 type:complete len:230 (-) Transcript_2408:744-1433(-)